MPCSLDGHPLKIKELRGDGPVESIDLSGKGLGVASAIVIGGLLGSNTTTKSLKCVACTHACIVLLDGSLNIHSFVKGCAGDQLLRAR